jgi:addiction module HigA family antidote
VTMKNPPHPGRSIRSACLEPLGLSISEGAKILGVTRQALNNVVAGKSAISPEMAIRLTKAFGSTEETWLRMQLAYDLAAARKEGAKSRSSVTTFRMNCTPAQVFSGPYANTHGLLLEVDVSGIFPPRFGFLLLNAV